MDRLPGFRGEFLWELDIVQRQTIALAEALPDEHYHWRPHPEARSVSEVFVHVATGNFMLLHFAGLPSPADLYPEFAAEEANVREGWESRSAAFIRCNDELVANMREKAAVVTILKRSFETVRTSFTSADLDRPRLLLRRAHHPSSRLHASALPCARAHGTDDRLHTWHGIHSTMARLAPRPPFPTRCC